MPLGAQVIDTGTIRTRGGELALERDEGGAWCLDWSRKLAKLAGRRVRIHAVRDGYNLLHVRSIEKL